MAPSRILITGPTASGKTELAVRLAEVLDGEIISVDSRQSYRGMRIGTAAPTDEQMERVPHHNVSILDPFERDNAASFRERALAWEEAIRRRGHRVIYCGGGTLHLQALISPFDDLPRPDPDNIARLEVQAEQEGLASLHQLLVRVDPAYAGRMDGMNRQRILRALDIWKQTGRPFSSFHTGTDHQPPPPDLQAFAIRWPREKLHERIEARTRVMFASGFREEVEALSELARRRASDAPPPQAPLSMTLPAPPPAHDPLRTLGFEQMLRHLEGGLTLEEAIASTITATRQYAKRQMTWFRRWTFLDWIDAEEEPQGVRAKSPTPHAQTTGPWPPAAPTEPETDRMLRRILQEVAEKWQNT
jgi:tRNA dimethylallyltransferase